MSGITIGIGFGTARTGVPTPAEICAYAERAEDLGIDSIWLSDRITGAQLDIACVMALLAARTRKIKMGPSVLTLPAHNPVHVARSYATLDHLTGGRRRDHHAAVGIGNDPKQCLAAGIPAEERGARMEEGVDSAAQAVERAARHPPRPLLPVRGSQHRAAAGRRPARHVDRRPHRRRAQTRAPATATAGSPRSSPRRSSGTGMEKLVAYGASATASSTAARPAPCCSATSPRIAGAPTPCASSPPPHSRCRWTR